MTKADSTNPINKEIPCECGNENHKAGLIVKKYGTLDGSPHDKVKIQVFDGDEIKSVVINKKQLIGRLKELK